MPTSPSLELTNQQDRQPQNIFYFPVAVKGEGVINASRNFVEHSREISEKHITESGLPLGLVPNVTYAEGTGSSEEEYQAIRSALNGAIELGEGVRSAYFNLVYKTTEDVSPTGGVRFPPGYANVPLAALEVFGVDLEALRSGSGGSSRTIAAKGFIETVEIGDPESNWDYFVAVAPQDVIDLETSFAKTCVALKGEGDSYKDVIESIRVVASILTGDGFDESEFEAYIADRENIPLSTKTLLGEGILNLFPIPAEPVAYQKEFCRTSRLLKLVSGNQRINLPYDSVDGGDLVWQNSSETYSYRNGSPYNWTFTDEFGRQTTFVPLQYLPRAPSEFVAE